MNLFAIIEEQLAVKFTGKINVLSKLNRQYLGHILLKNGELVDVTYKKLSGLKAFYRLAIDEKLLEHFIFIVEPEIVDEVVRNIHFPYAVLKNRFDEVFKNYEASLKFRPPPHLKFTVDVSFINKFDNLDRNEYLILDTLTEWNQIEDIYQHCDLLDFEITMGLVSLRKKGALKIIAPMNKEI